MTFKPLLISEIERLRIENQRLRDNYNLVKSAELLANLGRLR